MSKKLVVLSQSFKVQTSITQIAQLLFNTLLLKHSDTNREIYLYLTHVSNVENASTGIKTSIKKTLHKILFETPETRTFIQQKYLFCIVPKSRNWQHYASNRIKNNTVPFNCVIPAESYRCFLFVLVKNTTPV